MYIAHTPEETSEKPLAQEDVSYSMYPLKGDLPLHTHSTDTWSLTQESLVNSDLL